eukprot:scaffold53_cov193-Pinguiococcus_pyrenoidosus.AAC.28
MLLGNSRSILKHPNSLALRNSQSRYTTPVFGARPTSLSRIRHDADAVAGFFARVRRGCGLSGRGELAVASEGREAR